jgi:hypothetical protein
MEWKKLTEELTNVNAVNEPTVKKRKVEVLLQGSFTSPSHHHLSPVLFPIYMLNDDFYNGLLLFYFLSVRTKATEKQQYVIFT